MTLFRPKIFYTGLIYLLLSACASNPVKQDFGLSATLATIASEHGGMFYMLQLEISADVPENALALIRYERLDSPGEFKDLALGSMGKARLINFRSMSSPVIDAAHTYRLSVQMQDKTSRELVASYDVFLQPNITTKVSALLGIKLL